MKNLGQFFTPEWMVKEMIKLIQYDEKILEPSSGDGAFLNFLPKEKTIGIEIDEKFKFENVLNMDFFKYSTSNKFKTIIGNPPYIKNKEIYESTRELLPNIFDKRTNLYIYFMWKSLMHLEENGEIIFIVPREFIKTTSAAKLNEFLMEEGSFTYWKEYGDQVIFKDADPNVVVFRWEKNNFDNPLNFSYNEGQIILSAKGERSLKDFFTIHVGGASGANSIFIEESGNIDLIVSTTKNTGEMKKAHYYVGSLPKNHEYLLKHKEVLINRKIKKFNENNWFEWGRKIYFTEKEKIYVNTKTRDLKPFFTHNSNFFDGSLLCLEPKENININEWVNILNNLDWDSLGFKVGGRLVFGQRTLTNLVF